MDDERTIPEIMDSIHDNVVDLFCDWSELLKKLPSDSPTDPPQQWDPEELTLPEQYSAAEHCGRRHDYPCKWCARLKNCRAGNIDQECLDGERLWEPDLEAMWHTDEFYQCAKEEMEY